jgi:hypothetical protein
MSSTMLARLSGFALVAGGLLFAVGNLLHPLDHSVESQAKGTWEAAHIIFTIGAMILVMGLPALFQRQAERAGKLGLVAFVFLTLGLLGTVIPGGFFEAFVVNEVGESGKEAVEDGAGGAFLGIFGLIYMVGTLLFGIATYRARVFPRVAGAAIAVSAVWLFAVGAGESKMAGAAIIAGTAVWGLAFAWLGTVLGGFLTPGGAQASSDQLVERRGRRQTSVVGD